MLVDFFENSCCFQPKEYNIPRMNIIQNSINKPIEYCNPDIP